MQALQALVHRYAKNESDPGNVSIDKLADYMRSLDSYSNDKTLLNQLVDAHPDWQLSVESFSVLSSVDDCSRLIFRLAVLEPHIEAQLRRAIPQVAVHILRKPDLPLTEDATVLTVLDRLNEGLVGWTQGLGSAGDKLRSKLEECITAIGQEDVDAAEIDTDITSFLSKETNRILKLEQRLAAKETGLLRSQQSKVLSANMINAAMHRKTLTEDIIDFLQGPWHDSVQLIILGKGIESEEWQRAEKITETLIWTYQVIDPESESAAQETQHLYRIIEHLPGEIKELLFALEHNTDAAETAMEVIETDHVSIVAGQPLDYLEFDPIPCEESAVNGSRVSRILLRKVNALEIGQWFTYKEEHIAPIRIKLVLKLTDVKQLLFTNRNGMKVLQKNFDEFSYLLSSHIARPLNNEAMFSSTFRTFYVGLINEFERYQQLIADRKVKVGLMDEARKLARRKALDEAHALAEAHEKSETERHEYERLNLLEAAKDEAGKKENTDRVKEIGEQVKALSTGSFLKLPAQDGKLEECKLAVKITAADKLIFVNHSGVKVGEYNSQQLIELLVAGQAEISAHGVDFEDTLAQVVSKLRQDRNKSYDDLTGE